MKTTNTSKNKTNAKSNFRDIGSKNAAYTGKSSSKNTTVDYSTVEFAQDNVKLEDADIVSDVLATQKGLVKMYGTALTEVDCTNLRGILNNQLSECADDQFESFQYMHERGLYPTEQAPMPKIKQAKKRFTNKEKTFDK